MNYSELLLIAFLTCISIIATVWDLRFHRIPNWLTFPAAVVALIYHAGTSGWGGFLFSMVGIGAGIAILLPFHLLGGMGAGDVKLLGAVGGLLGCKGVFTAFLFTALAGGIYALVLLAAHGYLKDAFTRFKTMFMTFILTRSFIYIPPPGREREPQLLYGIAIAVGTMLSLGFGRRVF